MTAREDATTPDPLRNHTKTGRLRQQSDGRSVLSDACSVRCAHPCGLSVRALNVLKLFAAEITGECPPRENWTPSCALLREVTVRRLLATRNCGLVARPR
jgi:hypothetical protein